jgi:MFS transporter, SP family, sugar:H+ symporter
MGIAFVWAFILGAGILFFSDTPRFLYRKGQTEEAKRIMQKVYGAPANHYTIHVELEEIEAKLRAEANKEGPLAEWIHMFRAPKMGYRIALGMSLQMFQQLTGECGCHYRGFGTCTDCFNQVPITSSTTVR